MTVVHTDKHAHDLAHTWTGLTVNCWFKFS